MINFKKKEKIKYFIDNEQERVKDLADDDNNEINKNNTEENANSFLEASNLEPLLTEEPAALTEESAAEQAKRKDYNDMFNALSYSVRSLTVFLNQETSLAKKGMIEQLANLSDRKEAEMNRYAEVYGLLKSDPDLINYINDERRQDFIQLSKDFDKASKANELALFTALQGTKSVVECFRKALKSSSGSVGYDGNGLSSAPKKASFISIKEEI